MTFSRLVLGSALLLASLAGGKAPPAAAQGTPGAFGLRTEPDFFTVDTGAGLVFKIRRVDRGSHTQSAGDIASLVYRGVQYQDPSHGSQLNSGFDYLYTGTSAVSVSAAKVDADHIRITVQAGSLTHYYLAQRGDARIYMGTTFSREPDTLGLARFIVRIPVGALPRGPVASDLRGTTGPIEAGDVFGLPNGETRSKHYSNMRLKDWTSFGATGRNVGVWMVRDSNEGNSGGPFYRSLLNQTTTKNQELTYIINYGEAQTEPFRVNVLNTYILVFNGGEAPGPVDTSWLGRMDLKGFVAPSARGRVTGVGLQGRDPKFRYTVGFSNASAQYWTDAVDERGFFSKEGMRPGTFTLRVFKNELAVESREVTVRAGEVNALHTIQIGHDPAQTQALWRIGEWDGTPLEFLNGERLTHMHPSDGRMAAWKTPPYVIGTSQAVTGFPAVQWQAVNNPLQIRFTLTAQQVRAATLRVGVTTGFAGGRPTAKVNGWTSPVPAPSAQPKSRTLTVGTYRGNNTTYRFEVPASALVVGENVVTLNVASGSGGPGFLSPGYAFDAVDWVPNLGL